MYRTKLGPVLFFNMLLMGNSQAALVKSAEKKAKVETEKKTYYFVATVIHGCEAASERLQDHWGITPPVVCYAADNLEQEKVLKRFKFTNDHEGTEYRKAFEGKLKKYFQQKFSEYSSVWRVEEAALMANDSAERTYQSLSHTQKKRRKKKGVSYNKGKINIGGKEVVAYCCYVFLQFRLDPLTGCSCDLRNLTVEDTLVAKKCRREGFAYDYWDRKDTRQTQMTKGKGMVTVENRQLSNREDYDDINT